MPYLNMVSNVLLILILQIEYMYEENAKDSTEFLFPKSTGK
jgi:hypothetical protein